MHGVPQKLYMGDLLIDKLGDSLVPVIELVVGSEKFGFALILKLLLEGLHGAEGHEKSAVGKVLVSSLRLVLFGLLI